MSSCKAFGIDLGTTNTVASIYRNGKFEVLTSNFSEEKYPSVVSFPSKSASFVVGRAAKENAKSKPKESVYDVKRLIGIEYDSEIVRTMQKNCSFTIKDDGNNRPVISYIQNGVEYTKYPHEISAMVLAQVTQDMKTFTGFDIKDVVITVPAYFSHYQRKLTEDAAKIAGLNILEIITEPQATILASTENYDSQKERVVFLYDFGGGTFDVSILRVRGMEFEELALDGDLFLGGSDIDTLIMNAFMNDYYDVNGEEFPKRRLSSLRIEIEQAKILLEGQLECTISVNDFDWELSKSTLNELIYDKVKSTFVVCQRALDAAHLRVEDIDEVCIVGGSTRLSLVQEEVKRFFKKDEIIGNIHQDTAIAVGAAKYALHLQSNATQRLSRNKVEGKTDEEEEQQAVLPPIEFKTKAFSDIGIIQPNLQFKPIIKKNQRLPCDENYAVTNIRDFQTEITIPIIQRSFYQIWNAEKNAYERKTHYTKSSEIKITDVIPKPRGENDILMYVSMNEHGSMSIEIEDLDTGNEMTFTDILTTTSEEELNAKCQELSNQVQKNIEYKQIQAMINELLTRCSAVVNKDPTTIGKIMQQIRQCNSMKEMKEFERRLSQFE